MNAGEINMLLKERKSYQDFIKRQHRLPKSERDQKTLGQIRKKLEVTNRWLKDD